MRVLWIASNEGLFSAKSERAYNGGGWVAGLQVAVGKHGNGMTLGLAFLTHKFLPFKIEEGNCTYYPVNSRQSFCKKVMDRIRLTDTDFAHDEYKKIIDDFKPDIIHVFGVEMPYSYLASGTGIPTVVHLQGFLNPYLNAYLPPGMSCFSFARHSSILKNVLGTGWMHNYNVFRHKTAMEKNVLSLCSNVMGRTEWDRQIADLMAGNARYFHVDEVLRTDFYESDKWKYNYDGRVKIVTTISQTIYKGFDLILKTASLLHSLSVEYLWKVIGISRDNDFVKLFTKQYGISTDGLNIVFCGRMEPSGIIGVMKDSDLYVHPSYIDNSPNSVCEAQMLGVPVVACAVGGVPSLVNNVMTGLTVPANAPYELAYIIKHYCEYDMARLSEMEIQAAEKRHDRAKIVADLLSCYTECISGK